MHMNFTNKRKGISTSLGVFPGRIGHRVARINDSIFVIGGTDESGKFIYGVQRINCLNSRVDTLVVQNSLPIQGFSLFCFQQTLFIWAGVHFAQHSNQLYQFDGSRFTQLRQQGEVPKPRSYHASVTFGGKFLITFAGSDSNSFFKDWNLLNLKTWEWKSLSPSIQLNYSLGCSMVWVNSRGILMINQSYDQTKQSLISNLFYQFYVNDFNSGKVKIVPIQISRNSYIQENIFTNITVIDNNIVLILGGYSSHDKQEFHNLSFTINLENDVKCDKVKVKYREKSQFQTIFHKNRLYLIGGLLNGQQMEQNVEVNELVSDKHHFKRHVCAGCRLYFDEEWFKSSKQVFPQSKIKEQYDYNYHLKLDNRIISKLSAYISSSFYALTLLIQSLAKISESPIIISLQKQKNVNCNHYQQSQCHQYLKIGCSSCKNSPTTLINQFLMKKQQNTSKNEQIKKEIALDIEKHVFLFKLAAMRISKSCIFTLRVNDESFFILYFSPTQLACTSSNINPFTNYHYFYNTKTKQPSSIIAKSLIFQNVKVIFKDSEEYEEIGENALSIILFCDNYVENELTLCKQNCEEQTGLSISSFTPKQQTKNKVVMPLFKFSFYPSKIKKMPEIFLQNNPIKFINIVEILQKDAESGILQQIEKYKNMADRIFFDKISIYHYPSEYWFRRLLIYHSGRLIIHFQQNRINICGVIILNNSTQLDLAGKLVSQKQQLRIQKLIADFRGYKRSCPF